MTCDLAGALAQADVALDFSQPPRPLRRRCGPAAPHASRCCSAPPARQQDLEAALEEAAREIALLVAANTSVGVTLLLELTRRAAAALPASYDIDVLELHHRGKRDGLSGTALALGRAAAEARGMSPSAATSRPAGGLRGDGEIGFAAVRAGDLVGEHTVLFCGAGEQLSLTHRATDRAIFARGALSAALWLASRPPGRYGMSEFLGFKTGT